MYELDSKREVVLDDKSKCFMCEECQKKSVDLKGGDPEAEDVVQIGVVPERFVYKVAARQDWLAAWGAHSRQRTCTCTCT